MNDLVSIIMPVYNAQQYVGATIDSVLHQIHANWELVIINDGSTDHSDEIIRSYKDQRIHYLSQANSGVSSARNKGLKIMNGDFFCFLDADDLLPPNSLSDRLKILKEKPEVSFVDGRIERFFDPPIQDSIFWSPSFAGAPINSLINLDGQCFAIISWLIKRKKDFQYSFEEGLTHGEDLLFFISISDHGLYDFVGTTIYRYRIIAQSAMSNLDGLGDGYKKILKKLRKMGFDKSYLNHFRRKTKMIMLKSYLGRFQIGKGIMYWLR